MNWRTWFMGMVSASISGAATSIAVIMTDHNRFNFDNWAGAKATLTVAAFAAFISLLKYLAQYQIPGAPPNP